jgi:hypothetical protein
MQNIHEKVGKSINNYLTNVPLLGELRKRGIGGYRTAKSNLRGFPKVFSRVDMKTKLDFHLSPELF